MVISGKVEWWEWRKDPPRESRQTLLSIWLAKGHTTPLEPYQCPFRVPLPRYKKSWGWEVDLYNPQPNKFIEYTT